MVLNCKKNSFKIINTSRAIFFETPDKPNPQETVQKAENIAREEADQVGAVELARLAEDLGIN